jgi:biuret amidohydrolase
VKPQPWGCLLKGSESACICLALFSYATIADGEAQLRNAFGVDIPTNLEELLNPRRSALLVYDMQLGIIDQLKDGQTVVQHVKEVLHAARNAGVRVFHTRHLSLPKELMGAFQYRMAMAWQRVDDPAEVRPWFLRDSPGFAIVPELQPLASEAVFDKITMSAFEGTPLPIALRDCGIHSFVIVGVATEIGIEPTCRHGADLGFVPVLVQDACGAGDGAAAERALESLRFLGDTVLTDRKTVCETWSRLGG